MTADGERAPIEIEATLRIRNTTAEALLEVLMGWGGLGDLVLERQPSHRITDRYLDLPDGALRRGGFALRRRRVAIGSTVGDLITLKGLLRRARGLGIERFELEREDDPAGWEAIRRAVQESGVVLGDDADLSVIQERTTRRWPVLALRDGVPRVEICLDSVRFPVGEREILHDEVEIEARVEDDAETVDAVGRELLGRLPDRLVPWAHSKLEIGWGLDRLLATGELGSADPDGRLGDDDYARLERFLSRRQGS